MKKKKTRLRRNKSIHLQQLSPLSTRYIYTFDRWGKRKFKILPSKWHRPHNYSNGDDITLKIHTDSHKYRIKMVCALYLSKRRRWILMRFRRRHHRPERRHQLKGYSEDRVDRCGRVPRHCFSSLVWGNQGFWQGEFCISSAQFLQLRSAKMPLKMSLCLSLSISRKICFIFGKAQL